jgi:Transcriptional regulator
MSTRDRILDAAAAEMMQHGYAASSMSSIASRMGLTKGSLTRHFPTKEALARAVVENLEEAAIAQRELSLARYPTSGIRATIDFLLAIGRQSTEGPLVTAAAVLFTDRTSPTFASRGLLAVWNDSFTAFFELAQQVGELPAKTSVKDLAEYAFITNIGEAVFAARAYSPAAQAEPLHFLRFTLRAAGVARIDELIAEVDAALGLPESDERDSRA